MNKKKHFDKANSHLLWDAGLAKVCDFSPELFNKAVLQQTKKKCHIFIQQLLKVYL